MRAIKLNDTLFCLCKVPAIEVYGVDNEQSISGDWS